MEIDFSNVQNNSAVSIAQNVIITRSNVTSTNIAQIRWNTANYSLHMIAADISASSVIVPLVRLAEETVRTSNLTNTSSSMEIGLISGDDKVRLLQAPQLSESAMVKVYVLAAMALFSLLGNVLTMWNIYKTRLARRSSRHCWSAIYSLIFHLSIADLLVTGFCIVGDAAWSYTVQWMAGDLACKLVKLFQMFSLYLSTYVLVLIGVDRWIAVKYPMKSLNMAKRCYRLLGGIYILSFVLSLPQFFIFHVARGPFVEDFYQCVTHGFYTAEWQEQLYATFTLIFTFLLPLCILFGTYLSTFRTISSSEKIFQGFKLAAYTNQSSAQTNRQRLIHKAKMKSLRISVVIIFAFLICWTPYYAMMMIFLFSSPDKRLSDDLNSAIFFFGMSNSLVNPLIYGAFHLCPMRNVSKSGSKYYAHSLNRGDSQRTMYTAVTQADGSGRHIHSYRQHTKYRTQSNRSYKNVHQTAQVLSPQHQHHHSHNTVLTNFHLQLGNGNNVPQSAIQINFSDHNSVGRTTTLRANSFGAISVMGSKHGYTASDDNVSSGFLCTTDKSVSSV